MAIAVAIVGDPSPEWLLADFAAQSIGAISFGLYPTSSRDEAEFVLRHGGATVLIAEDQEHVDKVLPMLDRLPALRKLVVIDDSNMFGYRHAALMSLGDLMALGDGLDEREFVARGRAVRPDDGATIVYTSGTSAHPKGALYTHRSLIHARQPVPQLLPSSRATICAASCTCRSITSTSAPTRRKACW
jgi:long-chain acyl-CoA synthetase